MSSDLSLVGTLVLLAIGVLAVVVIIVKLMERKGDVLHGGYIKRDD